MLKNLVQLEHKVEGNVFHFLCASDAKLDHVKAALIKFIAHVSNVEDAAQAQPKPASVADPVVSEAPDQAPPTPEV